MSGQGPSRLSEAGVWAMVGELLANAGPRWLPEQRWFADKGRDIRLVRLDDLLIEAVGPELLLLAVARVEFGSALPARYLLPLAVIPHAAADEAIAPVPSLSDSHALVDGLVVPRFGQWLLELWEGEAVEEPVSWQFTRSSGTDELFARARLATAIPMRAEQSNTSIRFDETMIVKLFRRLQSGPNPDEEALRVLDEVAFPRAPRFAGAASWRCADGVDYPIALAQSFVRNQGDGWSWMIERLRALAASSAPDHFAAERMLGQRTGELHLALSGATSPDFSPQPANLAEIGADQRRQQAAVERVIALLQEQGDSLPPETRSNLPAIAAALRHAAAVAGEGYLAEAGILRLRGHGDFHLGQTLRTLDDDWKVIDFEGEPARPVEERRQRVSALKDVAGMLRSFNYARVFVARECGFVESPWVSERLRAWEERAREAYLVGYREAIQQAPVALVPRDDSAFSHALAAWELEKALYEIEYEARNRPDWLEIPLSAVLSTLDHSH